MQDTKMPITSFTSSNTTVCVLKIRVRNDNDVFELELETTSTIAALKLGIEEKTKIPPHRQNLALPGSDSIDFTDDNTIIGSVLKSKSTLLLRDSSLIVNNGNNNESSQGHQWGEVELEDTIAHLGDSIDTGFNGQAPQDRGYHVFGRVKSTKGTVGLGDHWRSSGSALPEHLDTRGDTCPRTDGTNAEGPPHRGNVYGPTTTNNTNLRQGDVINEGWRGSAPAGAGNHRFGKVNSDGGSLHMGNEFGQSDSVNDTRKSED